MTDMEAFCNAVVSAIKAAGSEEKVARIIDDSIRNLHIQRGSYNRSAYIMNMIVSLRATEPDVQVGQSLNSVKTAVSIFRELQKNNRDKIF